MLCNMSYYIRLASRCTLYLTYYVKLINSHHMPVKMLTVQNTSAMLEKRRQVNISRCCQGQSYVLFF